MVRNVYSGAMSDFWLLLFDRLAKVVLAVVLALSKFPADMVCQHLDDVVASAPDGCRSLWDFDWWYRKKANRVGITLAPWMILRKVFHHLRKE